MEENIVEDQGQEVSEQASDTPEEQSEATENVEEAKPEVFKDHMGRELTAEQLHSEYMKTASYVTKLEQQARDREAAIQEEAEQAVSNNELLQNVDPNVAEAIKQIVTPVIQTALKQRDEAAEQKARDEALKQSFDNAEGKYDGKDGYPKFNRGKVTTYMLENEVYDPERAYLLMNQSAIIDAEVRKAMKGGATQTESTAGSSPTKPKGKSPTTFEEATKRAVSRI